MILETERLLLRPWRDEDAEDLYACAKDPRVGPAAGWPVHRDVQDSLHILQRVLAVPDTFALCLKTEDRPIGSISLIAHPRTLAVTGPNEMEIGYWLSILFWGRGLMPEAVRAVQKYAFTEKHCTALWCGYYEGNDRSRRVMEKCGFIRHHTETGRLCELMAELRTEHYTRITREEWKKQSVQG